MIALENPNGQPDDQNVISQLLRDSQREVEIEEQKKILDQEQNELRLRKYFNLQKAKTIYCEEEFAQICKDMGTKVASANKKVDAAEKLYSVEGNDRDLTAKQKITIASSKKYQPILEELQAVPLTSEEVGDRMKKIDREIKNAKKAKQLSFDKHNDGSAEMVIRLPDGESTRKLYTAIKDQPCLTSFFANMIDGIPANPPGLIDQLEEEIKTLTSLEQAERDQLLYTVTELEEARKIIKDSRLEKEELKKQIEERDNQIDALDEQLIKLQLERKESKGVKKLSVPDFLDGIDRKIFKLLAIEDMGLYAGEIGGFFSESIDSVMRSLQHLSFLGLVINLDSRWGLTTAIAV